MKPSSNIHGKAIAVAAVTLALLTDAQAGSRTLTIPSYVANPGSTLEVPLTLDNAAGLAGLRVQVNFNPAVLTLQTVTAGPLGQSFEMSHGQDDGLVRIVFARPESLGSGSGRLAMLKFKVNAGAVQDILSELSIADVSLSDSTGVVDLRQKDTLTVTNGQLAVTLAQHIDNARNGLPDWWEELHGMSLFAANQSLDPDRDGLPNLLEYALNLHPNLASRMPASMQKADGTVEYTYSRATAAKNGGTTFQVEWSDNLTTWSSAGVVETQLSDDGTTQHVKVTLPAGSSGRRFMRLRVQ